MAFWIVDRALEREIGNLKSYLVPILQGDLEQMVKELQTPRIHFLFSMTAPSPPFFTYTTASVSLGR